MVETVGEVNPLAIEVNEGHEVMPAVEIEATAETPIHSQYQNLGILPHEVTSAFVRTFLILLLTFCFRILNQKFIKC